MVEENWREFIKRKRLEYKNIGHIECPALGNEKIYFNKYGWDHLMRKNGKLRPIYQQFRRMRLLPYVISIVSDAKTSASHSVSEEDGCPCHFWAFEEIINLKSVRVVIRKIGNGRTHFFSVMDDS